METPLGKLPLDVDMVLELGTITAITGPSGAGKTTLLRQIAGLAKPEFGNIQFGDDVWLHTESGINWTPQSRDIGFVFQDYALFPHLTVKGNLEFALDKKQEKSIVDDLLREVDMLHLANRKPQQLSGGQQQRVALARALVRQPQILLLDEPLSALDFEMRASMQELLHRLHQHYQFTMLIVTHDISEIFRLAKKVIKLSQGQIIKSGTPQQVFIGKNEDEHTLIIIAKAVSIQYYDDHMVVQAAIDYKIKQIKLPLEYKDRIQIGQTFSLKTPMAYGVISIIS